MPWKNDIQGQLNHWLAKELRRRVRDDVRWNRQRCLGNTVYFHNRNKYGCILTNINKQDAVEENCKYQHTMRRDWPKYKDWDSTTISSVILVFRRTRKLYECTIACPFEKTSHWSTSVEHLCYNSHLQIIY